MNGKSRRGQEWFTAAVASLEASGFELIESRLFTDVRKLRTAVREAIKRGDPLVVVGGGDGTISSIAGYFLSSDSILGVMPLGTGNSFARDLQINASVAEATTTIREGQVRNVDVSVANDCYFLNVATIGLTTKIAEALTGNQKRLLGRAAYLVAFCKGMARIRPFAVRIETDHGVIECSALQVVIGNGRFHGGPFPISPNAQITDGKLNVYVVEGTRRRTLLKAGFSLMAGRHAQLEEVTVMATSVCRVTAKPRRKVTIDGEVSAVTPLDFRVIPGGLRCVVPKNFES